MRKEQFIAYMEDPGKIPGNSIAALESVVKEFPYCQSAQLLLANALNNEKSIRYESQLKIAAAYAADRKMLYKLIMRKEQEAPAVQQIEKVQPVIPEMKAEPKIEAVTEEPIEDREEPKQEEIVEAPAIADKVQPPAIEEVKQEEIKQEEAKEEPKEEEAAPRTLSEIPPLEQNIIVKAIDASIELEVSEKKPFNEEKETSKEETLETERSGASNAETLETSKEETAETSRAETVEISKAETVEATKEETFDPNATHSFTEWLRHARNAHAAEQKEPEKQPEQEQAVAPGTEEKPKSKRNIDDLIDKFITEEPKISRPTPKQDFFSPVNKAKQSVQDDNEYVTETLANIYLKQGSHAKAIKAYETLSLKFPEKKLYFAARIKEIKKIIKEQK